MPTYRITAPDGKSFDVSGSGTAEEALAHVQATYAATPKAAAAPSDPSEGGGTLSIGPLDTGIHTSQGVDRFLSGAGKAFVDLGRGARQLYAGAADAISPKPQTLSGLVAGAPSRTDALNAEVADSRALDAPLMKTGAAKAGSVVGGIAASIPALAIPGANTVVGAGLIGGAYGALQPVTSAKERLTNTVVGGVTGSAAQYAGQKITQYAASRLASRAANAANEAEQNVVRDATLSEARQAGYVVPPSQTNPSAVNRVLETVSGKAATEQAAMARNQVVTNRLARKALELPDNAPITRAALNAIRSKSGDVYKAVKAAGEIVTDSNYLDDLSNITSSIEEVAKDFPDANVGANEEISKLVDGLLRDKFNSSSAVEYVKELRKSSSGLLSGANSADPAKRALGAAQREAAAAIEEQVMRHLESSGKGALASQFDKARRMIAKTYSVESALNESTGNVLASQLGTQLKRGKPLDSALETAAKFARAFPESAREAKRSVGISAVDAMIAGGGTAMGAPQMIALPVARYAARGSILSAPYQNAMAAPSYAPGATGNALLELMRTGGNRLAIPAAVSATYAAQQ